MIVLGLGSCFIAIATLAAVSRLDRIEASRGDQPPRAGNSSASRQSTASFAPVGSPAL